MPITTSRSNPEFRRRQGKAWPLAPNIAQNHYNVQFAMILWHSGVFAASNARALGQVQMESLPRTSADKTNIAAGVPPKNKNQLSTPIRSGRRFLAPSAHLLRRATLRAQSSATPAGYLLYRDDSCGEQFQPCRDSGVLVALPRRG